MKASRFIALLMAIVLLPVTGIAYAQEDAAGLERVDFHTENLTKNGQDILYEGMEATWKYLSPYLAKHGITSFPSVDIWAYNNKHSAVRYSGLNAGYWENINGQAFPGRAYMIIKVNGNPQFRFIGIAHEALHLLQYEMAGSSDIGSICLAEGAANWYARRISEPIGGLNIEEKREAMRSSIGGTDIEKDLPTIGKLATRDQFRGAFRKIGGGVYVLCHLAFDMLIQLEGGEEEGSRAYFAYLAELRRTDWRTAFNRVFKEGLDTFEKRFKIYRESGFEDWRLPEEIEREELKAEILAKIIACRPLNPGDTRICVK